MKHILEFESYEQEINEALIPVYNEEDYLKSPSAPPEMEVPKEDIVEIIGVLLGSQGAGKIGKILVTSKIPSQGKNAPAYIRDEIAKERERMAHRKYLMHGSRIEASDKPEDDYRDAINIFVDTEFVVTGVDESGNDEYVVTIPSSMYQKTQRDPSLIEKYSLVIYPDQIEEVSYYPVK